LNKVHSVENGSARRREKSEKKSFYIFKTLVLKAHCLKAYITFIVVKILKGIKLVAGLGNIKSLFLVC